MHGVVGLYRRGMVGGLWLALSLVVTLPMGAQTPATAPAPAAKASVAKADRWEAAMTAFETSDRMQPPVPGGNVFVGSSSIRLWPVAESFPGLPCLNRGFGGSQLPDVLKYVDRIVTTYQPAVVVLYCGDNDIGQKRTPEQIRDDYRTFVTKVHAAAPQAKIVWIAIKPSPKRWELREQAQQANQLVRESQAGHDLESYVDVWTPMLAADGLPQPELYVKDQLHMTPAGYAIWNRLVEPHLVKSPVK